MHPKDAEEMANDAAPDQTTPEDESGLGLRCLPRPVCLNIQVSTV